MKNLAILSGAIVAGLLAFTPASAGVSGSAAVMLYADAGAPAVTKAHYKKRRARRRNRRFNRYYGNYYGRYRRPYYRSFGHFHPGWGYHNHRRRGGIGLFFNF
ncbi:MAG: hypothetical protein ACTSY1_03925 [Alphaproteobacteria bacterium]